MWGAAAASRAETKLPLIWKRDSPSPAKIRLSLELTFPGGGNKGHKVSAAGLIAGDHKIHKIRSVNPQDQGERRRWGPGSQWRPALCSSRAL